MRVWLAPSAYFPHRGGVEEATFQLARQLDGRGHDVVVLAPRHPKHLSAAEELDGVRVRRIAFSAPRRELGSLARFPFSFVSQLAQLLRLWRRSRPDLVHVHCPSVQLPAVTTMCILTRTPLVVTSHGEVEMDESDLYGQSSYMRAALRWAAKRAAALTACSAWTAASTGRVASQFVHADVIGNGIDPDQWRVDPVPAAPIVGAWGRHVPQKGFDLLLEAFPKVRAELPDARLLLGGSGTVSHTLERMGSPGVTFTGPLDRAGVQALLSQSRVAVVPSRLEPFGIVALEAMATGRPVVWSTSGGLREATRGLGWGVDPTDIGALANAIVEALRAEQDPAALRAAAVSQSWSAICERYLAVYRRCVPT